MSQYIKFELLRDLPKTKVYSVVNIKSNYSLGVIKWYSSWRQYCFFPAKETIFNKDCMKDIIDFINKLMEARKG